jgi:hypothetical protein
VLILLFLLYALYSTVKNTIANRAKEAGKGEDPTEEELVKTNGGTPHGHYSPQPRLRQL